MTMGLGWLVLAWACAGVSVGAWLRAATVALPARLPVVHTWLHCQACGRQRRAVELVPLVGPVLEMRRAQTVCGEAARRLATEIAAACLFGGLAWRYGATWPMLLLSLYVVVFVLVVGIDLERRLILNRVLVPAVALALLAAPTIPHIGLVRAVVGGAVGLVFMLLPAVIARGGLGGGDVKLAGFLGLATGFPDVLTALVAGILFGGLSAVVLLVTRRVGRRDYLPYGPFLIAGAAFVLAAW